MRFFIVMCLVAVAHADKLGYNYHPVQHSDDGLSFVPGAAEANVEPSFNGAAENFAPSYGASSYNAPASGFGYESSASSPATSASADFNKEFYSFSANDEDFQQPAVSEQFDNLLKKNLRVIFINGPQHSGLENAALSLAKQSSAQQTAIYVLNKQADISELANRLSNSDSNANSKPDVHFVKYRTSEDAVNAQHVIQSQYDSLGGNAKSYDGEVVPALNFASQGAVKPNDAASATPEASYLPAVLKRLRI